MKVLKFVLEENEDILWDGIADPKETKRNKLILNISFFFLILFFIFSLIIMMIVPFFFYGFIIFYTVFIVLATNLILISFCIRIGNIFGRNLMYPSEEWRYYITNKKEFAIKKNDKNFRDIYDYEYYELKFNNIKKIVIRPQKRKKREFAHIDFYSNIIRENIDEFSFFIKKRKKQVKDINKNSNSKKILLELEYHIKPKQLAMKNDLHPRKNKLHRFYYIKEYKKVENLLRRLVPEKVYIDYSKSKYLRGE